MSHGPQAEVILHLKTSYRSQVTPVKLFSYFSDHDIVLSQQNDKLTELNLNQYSTVAFKKHISPL